MIALIYAHPHPARSRANRVLLEAARTVPSVIVRSLYDRYPDFEIDVEAERKLLIESRLIVWQHPCMWYSAPALQKLWFDTVLTEGWAIGEGGTALVGKSCLWVTTTGATSEGYSPEGTHRFPFTAFAPALEMTARFCGMHWLPPQVVHGAQHDSTADRRTRSRAHGSMCLLWCQSAGQREHSGQ